MKRFLLPVSVLLLSALIGHFAVLRAVPVVIMNKAMASMEARGIQLHKFTLVPRSTPQTQSVVRPSPDLAYSICLYDLKDDETLRVFAAPYEGYASVSFFDAQTNNFATVRVGAGENHAGKEILLFSPDAKLTEMDGSEVSTPTSRGIILIRRLTPNLEAYKKVAMIAPQDRCVLEKQAK